MSEPAPIIPQPLTAEQRAAQKRRNVWLALALVAFVVLVGVTTVIRIQDTDMSKSEGFYFDGKAPQISSEESS